MNALLSPRSALLLAVPGGLVTLGLACAPPPPAPDFGQPSLLEPLEENTAPLPEPTASEPYPEVLSMVSGSADNKLYFAHARTYVHASAAKTWAAFQDVDVVVDRPEVFAWSSTPDPEPEFDFSQVIHHEVRNVVNVEYDLTWVHELHEGSVEAPSLVVGQWAKTDGTNFIDVLSGSFVIREIGPEVVELELIEHLQASLKDEKQIEAYFEGLLVDVRAFVQDKPLPPVGQ